MLSFALTPRSDDEDHLHESLKPRLTSSPTDSGWDVCTADHLVDSLRILVAKRAVLFGGKNVVKRASTLQVTSQLLAKVFEQTCHILIFLFLCCRFLQAPAHGVRAHPTECRPCAFFGSPKGCLRGQACNFCHHEIHVKLRNEYLAQRDALHKEKQAAKKRVAKMPSRQQF